MAQEVIQILGVVQGTGEQHDVVLAGDVVHVRLDNGHTEFTRRRDHLRVAIHTGDRVTQLRQRDGQVTTTTTGLKNTRWRRRQ
ncbi:hypothetical protein GCM10027436_43420 [Actinophytocola sediminis]